MLPNPARSSAAAACVWVAVTLLLAAACNDKDDKGPAPVVVTTELTVSWDFYPHRLSVLELALEPSSGASGGELHAQCDGGDFGILDTPRARYGFSVWRSSRLRAVPGSVELEITPSSQVNGEPFSAEQEVRVPAGPLETAGALAAFVRGYRISTDEYEVPPPFETDPDLPYDPAYGYTTSGVGISLGTPQMLGDEIALTVRARNSLALSDRGDMNAAIPQATTWMRVDFVLVGAAGANVQATEGEASYYLSFPDYGRQTVHQHADPGVQHVSVSGIAGPARALFGLSGFDIWLNIDGRTDPSCVVTQDATNAWGEPISGPGRYVRELSVRIWDEQYDPATGTGDVNVDVYLSNSSEFKEVGNLCLGLHGRVTMLQFDDRDAEVNSPEPTELELVSGEPFSTAIEY